MFSVSNFGLAKPSVVANIIVVNSARERQP